MKGPPQTLGNMHPPFKARMAAPPLAELLVFVSKSKPWPGSGHGLNVGLVCTWNGIRRFTVSPTFLM